MFTVDHSVAVTGLLEGLLCDMESYSAKARAHLLAVLLEAVLQQLGALVDGQVHERARDAALLRRWEGFGLHGSGTWFCRCS